MELKFHQDYNSNSFFLVESTPMLMAEIEALSKSSSLDKAKIYIKQGLNGKSVFITNSSSYELKMLDNSNSFLVVNNEKKLGDSNINYIKAIKQHSLDLLELHISTSFIYRFLKSGSCLKYNVDDGISNQEELLGAVNFEELLIKSEMCRIQLQNTLIQLRAFEKNGNIYMFDQVFLNLIVLELLSDINNKFGSFDIEAYRINTQIFKSKQLEVSSYSKVFSQLSSEEMAAILNCICTKSSMCDGSEDDYIIDWTKVKAILALQVFYESKVNSLELGYFLSRLSILSSLYISAIVDNSLTQEEMKYLIGESSDNIFDYYSDHDLRYLKGQAVFKIGNSNKDVNIELVSQHYFSEVFEDRLSDLFRLKDRWTFNEIESYLYPEPNLKEKLLKYCKQIQEKCPFNPSKEITQLKLKFSFYLLIIR